MIKIKNRVLLFCSFSLVLVLFFISTVYACTTPVDDLYINESTTLCGGVYSLDDIGSNGIIIINESNIVLDCNGTQLVASTLSNSSIGYSVNTFVNVTLDNCAAESYGLGIDFTTVINSTIIRANISSSNQSDVSIRFSSTNNSVIDSLISNSLTNGIDFSSPNNIAVNNVLINSSAGVRIVAKNNHLINNTFIGDDTGVSIQSDNASVKDNQFYNVSTGISLLSFGIDNITITNNTFANNNFGAITIYPVGNLTHLFITNNTVISGQAGSEGIAVSDSSNAFILNSVFLSNTLNAANFGLRLSQCFNCTISSNIAETASSSRVFNITSSTIVSNIFNNSGVSWSLLINYSSDNIFLNNNISANYVLLSNSTNNIFTNNTIVTSQNNIGISLNSSSDSNIFITNNISLNTFGVVFGSSSHNLFINNTFENNSVFGAFSTGSGVNNTILNSTGVTTNGTGGILYVQWFGIINSTFNNGSIAPNVNASVFNRTQTFRTSGITNSSGFSPYVIVTQYYENGSGKMYETNVTINATLGSSHGSLSDNITTSEKIFDLILNTPPNVPSLNLPENHTNFSDIGSFSLNWSNVTDAEGNSIQYYIVEVSTDPSFSSFSYFNGSVSETTNVTNVVVSGLSTGFYYWRVAAYDGFDNSSYSTIRVFNVSNSAPSVPTLNLPINQTMYAHSVSSVALNWSNSTDSDGDPITYIVELSTDPSFVSFTYANTSVSETANTTGVVVSSLSNGAYYWRVLATAGGLNSSYSEIRNFNISNSAPSVPSLNAPPNSTVLSYDTSVMLNWSNSTDVDGDPITYVVEVSTNISFPSFVYANTSVSETANTTGVTISSLSNGQYYWRVLATDGSANSSYSTINVFNVSVNHAPSVPSLNAPVNLSSFFSNVSATISLNWSNSTDSDGDAITYVVEVSTNISFPSFVYANTSVSETANTTNVVVSSLAVGQYYWRVLATDGSVNSSYSTIRNFNISNTPPSVPSLNAPANLSSFFSNVSSTVSLNWSNSTDFDGDSITYVVEVSNNSGFSSFIYANTSVSETANTTNVVVSSLSKGAYYWRVLANDGSANSSYSTIRNFNISNSAPSTPTLNLLENNSNFAGGDLSLNWSNSTDSDGDAITYVVEVSTNISFPSFVYANTSVSETANTTNVIISGLNTGVHYWRVLANDGAVNSSYSTIRMFNVTNAAPTVPTLNLPENETSFSSGTNTVVLNWSNSTDSDGDPITYVVEVSTSISFASFVYANTSVAETTNVTGVTVSSLSNGNVYYWRVLATDGTANSSFSTIREFSIASPGGGGGGGGGGGCTNQCSTNGEVVCDGSGYRECGNFDSDSCLEWSPVTSCGLNEVCSEGACVCQELVVCGPWSVCLDGIQSRTCQDTAACVTGDPFLESRSCGDTSYNINETFNGRNDEHNITKCFLSQGLSAAEILNLEFLLDLDACTPGYGDIDLTPKCGGYAVDVAGEALLSFIFEGTKPTLFLNFNDELNGPYCPYCFDGVKDFDEEEVDCGGPSCPLCSEKPYYVIRPPFELPLLMIIVFMLSLGGIYLSGRYLKRVM